MSSIRKIKLQTYTPTLNRSAMIANIKMEIEKINNMVKYGQITPEEAQMKLSALEAKLSALESGQNIDGEQFEPIVSTDAKTFETQNYEIENPNNSQENQYSYFEQLGEYNKILHNIQS